MPTNEAGGGGGTYATLSVGAGPLLYFGLLGSGLVLPKRTYVGNMF